MSNAPSLRYHAPEPFLDLTGCAAGLAWSLGQIASTAPTLQHYAAQRGQMRADSDTIGLGIDQLTQFMPQVLMRPTQPNRGRELFPITDGGLAVGVEAWKREVVTVQGRANIGWKGLSSQAQAPTFTSQYDEGAVVDIPAAVLWNLKELEARAAAVAMGRAGSIDIIETKMMASRNLIDQEIGNLNIFGAEVDGVTVPNIFGVLTLPSIPALSWSGAISSKTGSELRSLVLSFFNTIVENNQNLFPQSARYVLHTSSRIGQLLRQAYVSSTYPLPNSTVFQAIMQAAPQIVGLENEFWCRGVNGDDTKDYMLLLPEKGSIEGAAVTIEVGGMRSTPLEIQAINYRTYLYRSAGGFDSKYPRLLMVASGTY